jgi:hypothetical protein
VPGQDAALARHPPCEAGRLRATSQPSPLAGSAYAGQSHLSASPLTGILRVSLAPEQLSGAHSPPHLKRLLP